MTTAKPEPTHETREGDTVTWAKAPECEVHRGNYDEGVPAEYVMQTIGNGFHYLCGECRILFTDEEKPLGTGVGQKIVVNARIKAQAPPPTEFPWPAGPGKPVRPEVAKRAAAKTAAAPAPQVPTIAEAAKRAPAKSSDAKAKREAAAKQKSTESAAERKAREEKSAAALDAAMKRARDREAAKAEPAKEAEQEGPPPGHVQRPGTKWTPSDPQQVVPPNLGEPNVQAEVERMIVAPNAEPEADK